MAISERLYTAEDLAAMSHGEDAKRFELVEGVLVEVSPSNHVHTELAVWIAYLLTGFVMEHDLGRVSGEIGGYILKRNPDIVRAPDVGFISKEKRGIKIEGAFYPFAPDLAVEIVSPGDSATEVYDKVVEYFQAGTRLVWITYPKSKTIHVYTSATDMHVFTMNDMLDGGDVLPGFKLPVSEVFKQMLD